MYPMTDIIQRLEVGRRCRSVAHGVAVVGLLAHRCRCPCYRSGVCCSKTSFNVCFCKSQMRVIGEGTVYVTTEFCREDVAIVLSRIVMLSYISLINRRSCCVIVIIVSRVSMLITSRGIYKQQTLSLQRITTFGRTNANPDLYACTQYMQDLAAPCQKII